MANWQLIETAPTDGTNVLLFVPHYAMGRLPYVILQGWNLAADRRGWRAHYGGGIIEPSHWMPLPPVPGARATVTAAVKADGLFIE
jgi:hypothetical protein